MPVIFLFIDGVGLGEETADNPFFQFEYPGFQKMTGGAPFTHRAKDIYAENHLFKAIDANLCVEGLPQSGTGQTALFTGSNASREIGKHFGPFPHSGIKHLLREQSLFLKAQRMGKSCRFINAYPDIFFKKSGKHNRWSCTTLMARSAGVPLNRVDEVKEGVAVTAGLTQQAWREKLGIDVPTISPEEAAERVLHKADNTDLVLHEYYLTDKAGHSRDPGKADSALSLYDRFLASLIDGREEKQTLVLCSDHGNVEDLSAKGHTRNKVPLFAAGPGVKHFREADSIIDVTPGILKVLAG